MSSNYYWVTSDNVAYKKKIDCKWWNRFSSLKERGIRKMTLLEIKKNGNIHIPFSEK